MIRKQLPLSIAVMAAFSGFALAGSLPRSDDFEKPNDPAWEFVNAGLKGNWSWDGGRLWQNSLNTPIEEPTGRSFALVKDLEITDFTLRVEPRLYGEGSALDHYEQPWDFVDSYVSAYHCCVVDVDGTNLEMAAYDITGNRFDGLPLSKEKAAP